MADAVVEQQEQSALDDLDYLCDVIPGDIYLDLDDIGGLDLDLPPEPSIVDPSPELSNGPLESISSRMNEIERFLLQDGGEVGADELTLPDDFFSDVFFGGSDDGSVKYASSDGDAATPEANAAGENEENEKNDESEGKSGEDEDLISKKRRRQMRNRDSAMKSRERKKMYVRDLEMKSKFLESECRRLGHALHCCAAENVALRHRLQNDRAIGAPLAKQESAVLFMESLLLGSLFWLATIVRLFPTPGPPTRIPDLLEVVENVGQTRIAGTEGVGSKRLGGGSAGLGTGFIFMRRKCKAARKKMKICMFTLRAVIA